MLPFTTEHLLLRPLEAADAPGMFALDSDPAVRRYLGGIGGPQAASPPDSLATIEYIRAQYTAHDIGRWAVLLRATGAFMGWAGLKLVAGPINGQRNFYDLGYRFLPRYWGQGYGYEAAQAWLAYGFDVLKLPRICAYADVQNAGSRRILEKIGLAPGNEFVENGTACVWYEAPNPVGRPPSRA
ncbi:GNAT family N-acetyltransferase [Hymenobacter cheonanensis]|uniref:GNAT family N-acetyltransferase n=1 Tax=Hymenobacter sp. CA2-7 TaxID=3063993 RepID=UPI002713FD22|nr:GNAT family N-acetyltransferase [Hymenobacter sp. CA2-7]MDO7885606.1 GNAT family N-acetyltransferase [Hymenobacter sp. CA2-7]